MPDRDASHWRRRPSQFPADTHWPPAIDPGPDLAAWAVRRAEIEARWRRLLGPWPDGGDLQTVVLGETAEPGFRRRRIRYRIENPPHDHWVEAYLLIPTGDTPTPRPGIVVYHPTYPRDCEEPAGLAGPASRHSGVDFVRQGYVVLCPRNFLWEYAGPYHDFTRSDHGERDLLAVMARLRAIHPQSTGMGKMTAAAIAAVSVLAATPGVDAGRLQAFGFSLGAKEALFAAAFDSRLRSAVFVDGGIGLGYSNWHSDWFFGERLDGLPEQQDLHELLALVAPRRFLLAGSGGGVSEDTGAWIEGFDGDRSWPYIEAALPVYRLHAAAANLAFLSHNHGHSLPAALRQAAAEWLADGDA